ncbi:hypothetical protein FRC10_001220, partial [Ceratobasidium sp. 414]
MADLVRKRGYRSGLSDFIRNTQYSKRIGPSDLRAIEGLLLNTQALYDSEDNRKFENLEAILDVQITLQAIKKCNAGGLILSRHLKSMGLNSGYCAIVEAKKRATVTAPYKAPNHTGIIGVKIV